MSTAVASRCFTLTVDPTVTHRARQLIKHRHEEIERVFVLHDQVLCFIFYFNPSSVSRPTQLKASVLRWSVRAEQPAAASSLTSAEPPPYKLWRVLLTCLDTAVGMHRTYFSLLLESIHVENRNKALYVQYLPRRLRHFNTLVTQREEKKEPSQINIFQEQHNLRHTINARITAGIHSRVLWQSWLQADLTAVR